MATFRVHKDDNFTTMGNHHFRNKKLSFKAKGLLSVMLSLPEDWDYSVSGLTGLGTDEKASVSKGLQELEQEGYLKREPIRINGKIKDWNYDIYEIPLTDFQEVDFQELENHPQLNTNILNTKELNIPPIIPPRTVEEMFNDFWKEYPRKEDKQNAKKKFEGLKPNSDLLKVILGKLKLFKKAKQWNKENGQYIPLPTTFINGRRWEDEIRQEDLINDNEAPDWFNKNIETDKLSETEEEELKEMLEDVCNESKN